MSRSDLDQVEKALDYAIPRMQQDFLLRGPLRGELPVEIRADIVRVFTQLLSKAIRAQNGDELATFLEAVVWEARKLKVAPQLFEAWLDRYELLSRELLDENIWHLTEPLLDLARRRVERLEN